jgi:GntP family gluconate:H+ symporter
MQIPIGLMMIMGTIVGLFTITAGYYFSVWANHKWPLELQDSLDARLDDLKVASEQEDSKLPGLSISLLPVLIPLGLICLDTVANVAVSPESIAGASNFFKGTLGLIHFLGNKNSAIVLGGIAALLLMVSRRKQDKEGLSKLVQAALMSGGGIILITAAGGLLAVCFNKPVSVAGSPS